MDEERDEGERGVVEASEVNCPDCGAPLELRRVDAHRDVPVRLVYDEQAHVWRSANDPAPPTPATLQTPDAETIRARVLAALDSLLHDHESLALRRFVLVYEDGEVRVGAMAGTIDLGPGSEKVDPAVIRKALLDSVEQERHSS